MRRQRPSTRNASRTLIPRMCMGLRRGAQAGCQFVLYRLRSPDLGSEDFGPGHGDHSGTFADCLRSPALHYAEPDVRGHGRDRVWSGSRPSFAAFIADALQ